MRKRVSEDKAFGVLIGEMTKAEIDCFIDFLFDSGFLPSEPYPAILSYDPQEETDRYPSDASLRRKNHPQK